MKNILLTLAILTIAIFSADAQFSIGVKGGITETYVSRKSFILEDQGIIVKINTAHNGVIRAQAGIVSNYAFSDLFSLQGEMLYRGVAYQLDGSIQDGNSLFEIREKLSADYLTVPLSAKFSFGNKVKFYALAGPHIGFWLGAKQTLETKIVGMNQVNNEFVSQKYEFDKDDDDDVRDIRVDLGLHAGVGLAFQVGQKGQLFIEGDLAYGLKGFRDFITTESLDHDIMVVNASVGYMIMLGGNSPRGR